MKARRNAERKRTSVACARCKVGKTKCSDYRPCKKCKQINAGGACVNEEFSVSIPNSSEIFSNLASTDKYELCQENSNLGLQTRFSPDRSGNSNDFYSRERSMFRIELAAPQAAEYAVFSPANSVQVLSASNAKPSSTATGFLQTISSSESSRHQTQQMQYTQLPNQTTNPSFPQFFPATLPLLQPTPQTLLAPAIAASVFGWAAVAAAPRLTAPSIDISLLIALRNRLQAAGAAQLPHGLAPIAPLPSLLRR
jgi:hypothetical protein